MREGRPLILVVEDEEAVRGYLRKLLTLEGYEIIEAPTVDAGLSAVASTDIDLVILDVRLSERQSGLQLLDNLRSHPRSFNIPVIILTGKQLTEDEEAQIRAHVAYVFYKPVDTPALLQYVRRLTESEPV